MSAVSSAPADLGLRSRLVEVAEDVYAYVQPPGGWCVSNAGVLVGADGAVVVDTLATEARALRLRAAVDKLEPGPRRTIIATHSHGDHTFGAHVFGPAAVVIGHEQARAEMAETGLGLTALWPEVEWGDVRVNLPAVTFRDELLLHAGPRTVRVMHVGPAHTRGDAVVWLPDDGVLFAGDVVLSGCTPFVLFGSVRGTLAAVDRLRALGATTVVCGHGAVAGPDVFDETARYLRWVQGVAAAGMAAGVGPLEAARQAGDGGFRHLLDPERTVGNLHRAYAELAGSSQRLDPVAVFAEMVAFNGGQRPLCLA